MTHSEATTPVPSRADPFSVVEGATLALLLAIASIELVGYRYGDSNHGITVPILKSFIDPSLYRWDPMVATADRFPTVFYRGLAALLPDTDGVPGAFFVLYLASMAAAFAGVYRIGCFFGGRAAGLVAMAAAIPVRVSIANEGLYRPEFSHSHIASALAIWAMVLFLEGRRLLPLLMLSLGAYNHLLYSVYVLAPCLLVVACEWRDAGARRTLVRLAAGTLPLLPFGYWALANRVPMTAEWLALLRLRSYFHSFPSYFGSFLPAGAFLLALGTMALSRQPPARRRLIALFFAAFAALFVLGSVFAEAWPLKAVLQMQPLRSWRFLMLLLWGLVAEGVVAGWRSGGVARLVAGITAVVLVDPRLEPLLPLAVFLQAAFGRPLPALWARLVGAGCLLALAGWNAPGLVWSPTDYPFQTLVHPTVLTAAGISVLVVIGREAGGVGRRLTGAIALLITVFWFLPATYAIKRLKWETGPWREVQDWVRLNTPKDAVLLTRPQETGFRVFSERAIVGEWKDGTQQYFDEAFAHEWAERMRVIGREGYARLDDDALLEIAWRYRASYIVTLSRREHPRLNEVYRNYRYTVYEVPEAQ